MELGYTAEQMSKRLGQLFVENHKENDKLVSAATSKCKNEFETLSESLLFVSRVIVPATIFQVIEENNKLIASHIEKLLPPK